MTRPPHRRPGLRWALLLIATAVVTAAVVAAPPKPPPVAKPAATAPAADWCRRVSHAPQQPRAGEAVEVSAELTAGVTDVALQYQLVDPGDYVERADSRYANGWVTVPMAAVRPADGGWRTHVVKLDGGLQTNRRLVRYRITAKVADGHPVTEPTSSDAEGKPVAGNHAYFVYDGVPAWTGAIKPGSRDATRSAKLTFPPAVMGRVQVYHLLGKKQSVENATWNEQVGGKDYKYTGTLVADGVVHDHVRYRARGGVWRYAMGKNQWKFDLPDGARLAARDDFGRPYPVGWGKVNLRGVISMGDYGRRGEQGLYESVGLRLFNLAGVPAPRTHWVHLRIVDEPTEVPADQYAGDFWGLYLAIENEDGRFLKAHDLPDGNVFKMAGGGGELSHQGEGQPADRSDLDAFLRAYNERQQPDDWWRANLDLASYYSYRSILECIHHYDIADGKNYDYYRNPETGRWQVIPWDLDLTWADHMYGNGEEPFNSRVLGRPAFRREYQNRLREVRDLLFNPEQAGQLIDEAAAVIGAPAGVGGGAGGDDAAGKLTLAEADRRRWDFHPVLGRLGGQAGQGKYYEASPTKDFAGMATLMKQYVELRGKWVDETLLNDPKVPATPRVRYVGPAGFPAAGLRFSADPYRGADTFAAMKWRLTEVASATTPRPADARPPVPSAPRRYEVDAVWVSEESPTFAAEATVSADVVTPGRTYRLRVRMKDAAGRWSHWSAPVEFVAGGR